VSTSEKKKEKKSSSSKESKKATLKPSSSSSSSGGDVFTVKVELRVSSISHVPGTAALVQLRAAKSKATKKAWAQSAPQGVSASKRDVVFKGAGDATLHFQTHLTRTKASDPVAFDAKPLHLILYDCTSGTAPTRLSRAELDLGALFAAYAASANEWGEPSSLTLEPSSKDKSAAAAKSDKKSRLELQFRLTPVKMNHRRLTLVDESNETEAARGTTTSVGADDYLVASESSASLEMSEAVTDDDPEEGEGAAAADASASTDEQAPPKEPPAPAAKEHKEHKDKSEKSEKSSKEKSSKHESAGSGDARVKELEEKLAAKEKELTTLREKTDKQLATARTVMVELQDQVDADVDKKELVEAKKYAKELEAEVAKLADAQRRTAELETLSNSLLEQLRVAKETSDSLQKDLAHAKAAKPAAAAAAADSGIDFVAVTARIGELEQAVKVEKERSAAAEKSAAAAVAAAEKRAAEKASEAVLAAEKKAAANAAEEKAVVEKKLVSSEKKLAKADEKLAAAIAAQDAAEKKAAAAEEKLSAAEVAAATAGSSSSSKSKQLAARVAELEKALEDEKAAVAEAQKRADKKKTKEAARIEELEKQLADAAESHKTALAAAAAAAAATASAAGAGSGARVAELEEKLKAESAKVAVTEKKLADVHVATEKRLAESIAAAEKRAAEAAATAAKKISAETSGRSSAELETALKQAAAEKAAAVDAQAQVKVAQARIGELEAELEKNEKRAREREDAFKKDVAELKRASALQRSELEAKLATVAGDASTYMEESNERTRQLEQQLAALELSGNERKAASEQQRAALEAKLAAAEQARDAAVAAEAKAVERARDLDAQVASLEHKRAELEQSVERSTARAKSIEQQLAAAASDQGAVGKEATELRQRVHALEDELAALASQLKEASARCETLEDELGEAEAKLSAKILKLKDVEESLDAASADLEESNAKMLAVKKRVTELESKNEELAARADEASSKVGVLEQQLAAANDALKDARADLAEAQAKCSKAASDVVEREEELTQAMIDRDEAEKRAESLKSQLDDREAVERGDADEMAQRLTAATAAAAEAKHRVADLETTVSKRDAKIASLERDLDELTDEAEQLERKLADAQKSAGDDDAAAKKLEEAQDELAASKKAVKAAEAKVRELETELDTLREQAASAKATLSQRISKLETDIDEARSKSNASSPSLQRRASRAASASALTSSAKIDQPPSDLQAYAERLEQERDELETELASARAKISRLETEGASSAATAAASSSSSSSSSAAAVVEGTPDEKRAALMFDVEVLTFLETQVYQAQQVFVPNSECAQLASRVFYQLSLWKAFDSIATPAAKGTLPRTLTALRTYCELASGERRGAAHCISALASLRGLVRQLAQQNKVGANVSLPANVLEFLVGVERVLNRAYRRYTQRLLAVIKPTIISSFLQKRRRQAKGLPSVEHDATGTRDIVHHLDDAVRELEAEHVPVMLIVQIAASVFQYIAHHVCNAVLGEQKPPSYATPHNGFQIKLEVSTLDEWTTRQTEKYGDMFSKCTDTLRPALELATALVMDKSVLGDASSLREVCPSLNYRQVLALVNNYDPDSPTSEPVPKNVAANLLKLAAAEEKKQQGASLPVLFDSERVFDPVLP
jgi:predicted  nucleic acid-binding Zn-ribbon protein